VPSCVPVECQVVDGSAVIVPVSTRELVEQNMPLFFQQQGASGGSAASSDRIVGSNSSNSSEQATTYVLEDDIKVNYSSPLMKARMIEILLLLEKDYWKRREKIIMGDKEKMGDEPLPQSQEHMLKSVFAKAMNMQCLYEGLDKHRFCRTSDSAKLATFGTGHCHGLSSVMAALLYPFSHLLGIYQRYTGGYHFERPPPMIGGDEGANNANNSPVTGESFIKNTPERHQWIELCFHRRGAGDSESTTWIPYVCDMVQALGRDADYFCKIAIGSAATGNYNSQTSSTVSMTDTASATPDPGNYNNMSTVMITGDIDGKDNINEESDKLRIVGAYEDPVDGLYANGKIILGMRVGKA
jgi:hypothetical protein